MRKIVFTIVAKNYVGLAFVLGQSVLNNSAGTDFYIIIADEVDDTFTLPAGNFTCLIAKDTLGIAPATWQQMAFKYTLTEFCTAIKPFCFAYFFNRFAGAKAIYFDPDILVFSSLDDTWKVLDNKTVILTPHILTQQVNYTGSSRESSFLMNGIYNLGFIAIANNQSSGLLIEWWQNRLVNYSFADKMDGLYTDQKWMDFLPVFLPPEELEISRNPGMNLAPWNYHERQLVKEGGSWLVVNRIIPAAKYPLVFVHYSGFNYRQLTANAAVNKNIPNLVVYKDIQPVIEEYIQLTTAGNIAGYFNYRYTYNYFNNGDAVLFFYRRLYRRLLEDDIMQLNPFDSGENGSMHNLLKKAHLLLKVTEENVDSLNDQNFSGFDKKLLQLNRYHKFLRRILGARMYMVYSKFMMRYHRPENQVFLLMDEYMRNNYKIDYC